MKTKSSKTKAEIQTLERFLRRRSCMLAALTLLAFGMIHIDARALSSMRQAYLQGFGVLGSYLRENEPVRSPDFGFQNRQITVSGS